jgi:hypothetical protein
VMTKLDFVHSSRLADGVIQLLKKSGRDSDYLGLLEDHCKESTAVFNRLEEV